MQNIMWGHPHCSSILCHTNQHTDLVNSSLITTANHSLTPSFSGYFHKQCKWPLCKRNYLQEATPISSVDQPMAEQAGQQATRIKKEAILTNIRLAWKTGCVSRGRTPVTRSESRGQPPAEVGELPAQRVEKRPVDPDVQSLWRMRVPTPSPPGHYSGNGSLRLWESPSPCRQSGDSLSAGDRSFGPSSYWDCWHLSHNIIKLPYVSFLFHFFCKFFLFIYPVSLVFPDAFLYSLVNFWILCLCTNFLLSRFAPVYIFFCPFSFFSFFPCLLINPFLLLIFNKTQYFPTCFCIYIFDYLPSLFSFLWTVLRIYFSVPI